MTSSLRATAPRTPETFSDAPSRSSDSKKASPPTPARTSGLEHTDQLWGAMTAPHAFVDLPGDLGPSESISHLLHLRERLHAGYELQSEELFTTSQTVGGNQTKLHLDRDYFTHGLIPAIANAQSSIHMAMLTLDGGELGEYIVDLLVEKKQSNPDLAIRVLVDDFGSNALIPCASGARNLKRLCDAGIEVEQNHFIIEGLEHRKVLLVDGKQAFLGGACFGDPYFGNEAYWRAYNQAKAQPGFERESIFHPDSRPQAPQPFEVTAQEYLPEYHDFGIEFEGPIVHNLQASFLQSWLFQGNELEPWTLPAALVKRYFPTPKPNQGNLLPVKLSHSIPKGVSEYRQMALDLVDSAKETLDIHFAYILIPEFIETVQQSAARGVKIRILVPGEEGTDKESTWSVFRSHYPQLLQSGHVEMFEYKTYTHCKFMVADNQLVFTSTGNPEYNTWEGGWDESALIDSPAFASEINQRVFDVDLSSERAEKIGLEHVARISLWGRIKQWVYVLFFSLFQSPREPVTTRRPFIRPDNSPRTEQTTPQPVLNQVPVIPHTAQITRP